MPKNLGPCNVLNCEAKDVLFRRFTEHGLSNAIRDSTYNDYNYLQINDQLCPQHYLLIVQSKRNPLNQKRKSRDFENDNLIEDNLITNDDIIEDNLIANDDIIEDSDITF
nr:14333_t:CDS:2 [Entrophospora candida]